MALGTPERIDGRHAVATFFNGAAQSALPVFLGGSPSAARFHRGQAKVAFAFTIVDGVVRGIRFEAAPEVLTRVRPRDGHNFR